MCHGYYLPEVHVKLRDLKESGDLGMTENYLFLGC